jgi:hypothetical protein
MSWQCGESRQDPVTQNTNLERSRIMASVFMSYRRDDSPGHAGRLFDQLRSSFGSDEVFMDLTGIPGGGELLPVIKQAIHSAKVLVVVIGPGWNRNRRLYAEQDWIRQEITLALKHKIHIIPVLVNGAPLPTDVPRSLQSLLRRNVVEVRDNRWDADVHQVINATKLILSPGLAAQQKRSRKQLRVLLIHDLEVTDGDRAWEGRCRKLISDSANRWSTLPVKVDVQIFSCIDVFEQRFRDAKQPEIRDVMSDLLFESSRPGAAHDGSLAYQSAPYPERLARTARLIGSWLIDDQCRRQAGTEFGKRVRDLKPDVVLSYGLGSLVAYDVFARQPDQVKGCAFVTIGSPLGLRLVRSVFGGRIVQPRKAKFWLHLFNPEDCPSVGPLRLAAPNFAEIEVAFQNRPMDSESVEEYLNHTSIRHHLWRLAVPAVPTVHPSRPMLGDIFVRPPAPTRRALVVGVNEYNHHSDSLGGCVNDVYLMSSVLQEIGFPAEEVALLTNERATSAQIRRKLHWLLDDASDGQQRVFYFSGHGALLPAIGPSGAVHGTYEALAPFDFDWSMNSAIHDDFLVDLYAQLPYGTSFVMILDCGFGQSSGQLRYRGTRGLNPPDDIQHSMLRWDSEYAMWVPAAHMSRPAEVGLPGRDRSTRPLGLAVSLQDLPARLNELARKTYGHLGPYHPVVLQACSREELCLEYRHGSNVFGAFSYALSECLKRSHKWNTPITYARLAQEITLTLRSLGCPQTPKVLLPATATRSRQGWRGA